MTDFIAVKDPGPSAQLVNDWFTPVRYLQRYSISAKYMRQTGYRGSLRIGIKWCNQAGAEITTSWSAAVDDPSPVGGDTIWQLIECRDLLCPSNAHQASLVIEVGVAGLTDHSGAQIWFDNTDMGENFRWIKDIDGVLDGVNFRKTGAAYVDLSNRVRAYWEPRMRGGGQPRFLSGSFTPTAFRSSFPRNGGFGDFSGPNVEGDPPDWWDTVTGTWGTDVTIPDRDGLVPRDGDHYLRFMATDPAVEFRSEWFPVEGGTSRVFTYLIANISLVGDPRVTVEWGDGYQGFIGFDTQTIDHTLLAPSEWVKKTFPVTAPATAGWARLSILRDNGASVGGETTGEFLFGSLKSADPTTSGAVTLGDVGSAPNAKAATLVDGVLTLQPADALHPGVVEGGYGDQQLGYGKKIFGGIGIGDLAGDYIELRQVNPGVDQILEIFAGLRVYNDLRVGGAILNFDQHDSSGTPGNVNVPDGIGAGRAAMAAGARVITITSNKIFAATSHVSVTWENHPGQHVSVNYADGVCTISVPVETDSDGPNYIFRWAIIA